MNFWIGVDVSKDKLDLALLDVNGRQLALTEIKNSSRAVVKQIKTWKKEHGLEMTRCLLCLEATGHYGRALLNTGLSEGWKMWQAHALDINRSMGLKRVKNDSIDALNIAEYAKTFSHKKRLFKSENMALENLRNLITRRKYLVRIRAKFKAHLTDLNKFMEKDVKRCFDSMDKQQVKNLAKQIARVDELIKQEILRDKRTARQYELLLTIPGIGPQTATSLIAQTDAFYRFSTPRELACHAGVAPFERLSGSSIRGRSRVSKHANKQLKNLLHLAAMAATNTPGEMKDYYQRKVAEGKNGMLVLNAVRNKLIHRAYAVIKNNRPYIGDYQSTA